MYHPLGSLSPPPPQHAGSLLSVADHFCFVYPDLAVPGQLLWPRPRAADWSQVWVCTHTHRQTQGHARTHGHPHTHPRGGCLSAPRPNPRQRRTSKREGRARSAPQDGTPRHPGALPPEPPPWGRRCLPSLPAHRWARCRGCGGRRPRSSGSWRRCRCPTPPPPPRGSRSCARCPHGPRRHPASPTSSPGRGPPGPRLLPPSPGCSASCSSRRRRPGADGGGAQPAGGGGGPQWGRLPRAPGGNLRPALLLALSLAPSLLCSLPTRPFPGPSGAPRPLPPPAPLPPLHPGPAAATAAAPGRPAGPPPPRRAAHARPPRRERR